MNILFVNYGDFTTNSLNHIGGFANRLCAAGHACVVAVPRAKETIVEIADPVFIPAEFSELLSAPGPFPDGRPAELIHAWTPREQVRRFVLAYQRRAHARLVVHLEDNEDYLLARWLGRPVASLSDMTEADLAHDASVSLCHPRRWRQFLRAADGITVIVESLRSLAPAGLPCALLSPGVDLGLYRPAPPPPGLREELGLRPEEKVIVFTGSNTFANEPEMRELYVAVALLNQRGVPTRLLRTGHNTPRFQASLPAAVAAHVLDLGFVAKARLPALLTLADVLIQPGRPGPFNDFRLPSKLPEFFAAGRPVILPAANVGTEVRDGIDALVLRTGSPDEIADLCQKVFDDPALARRLEKNAVTIARARFDLAANSRGLAEFYQEVMARPPAPGSTAVMDASDSEISLALRRLAAYSADPEAAALAAELVPLVADLESHDSAGPERERLEREAEEWRHGQELSRAHIAHVEEELGATKSQLTRISEELELTKNHLGQVSTELNLTKGHTGNLEAQVKLSDQHGQNLGRELQDARGRLQRLEGKYAISEKLLTSTRRQLDALDAEYDKEISAARTQLADFENQLRLTRQHAANLDENRRRAEQNGANLENLRSALQRRIGELDAQCEHLTRTIADRDATVDRLRGAEAKLATLQRSLSWRITLPWRVLRRNLVDPWRRRPRAVAALPEAPAATSVPTQSLPAAETPDSEGGRRPPVDVGRLGEASLPRAEQPRPEVAARLAPVAAALAIWRSVDNPQSWSLPPRRTLLRGWCFADDGRKLVSVRAVLADRVVDGTYGFKRLDVLASVRGKPQAEYCGWQIEVELAETDTLLDLEAADEAGDWHPFFHTGLKIGEGLGPLDLTQYERWIEVYDRPDEASLQAQTVASAALGYRPLLSVLVPVYNTDERWLRRAIDSVRAQSYAHWELCLADDASTVPHVRAVLAEAARDEPRIKVVHRSVNGHISAASNSALELARGDFVALLDHDDELAPHALYEVAATLNAHPGADYIYSDEDKIDENGRRHEPYFKPDWMPDLITGQNYACHLSVFRTEAVRKAGGFRRGFEGSQDWDLILRVTEASSPDRIVHIPKVLYHWRAIPGSTALQLSEKNYPLEAARRALAEHFRRRDEAVELIPIPGDHWRVKRRLPNPAPSVSLIIPTRNRLELLRPCVESILARTVYPRYEIVIVDNQSDDPATLAWLAEIAGRPNPAPVRVLRDDTPFNFSAICNRGVASSRADIVGLLNNDLEVIAPEWLEEMASQAIRPEIGCVGAMLYYPNDTVQHAGVILGVGGVAGHAFRDFPRGTEGKLNRARLVQNYSAVTAACLLVRRGIYQEVGGLDENTLAVAFNDIDFCLKVGAAGYRNLWTPFAEFYHHESASRGVDDTPEKAARFQLEVELMLRRWGPALQHDPAYNPNLTLELNDFSLASPPRPPAPVTRESQGNGHHLRELWQPTTASSSIATSISSDATAPAAR